MSLELLKNTYAGTDLLINRKVQAFYFVLLSLICAMLCFTVLAFLFSFPNKQGVFTLTHYIPLLLFAIYLLFRGRYDVALWLSYISFLTPLVQIAFNAEPVTRETVYFVTLIQSAGIVYLTLLTHRRGQILFGGIIALGVELAFLFLRIYLPMKEISSPYLSNAIGAVIILLIEIIIGFLIHTLLYDSLSEIMFQMDYDRDTGIPNGRSMITAVKKISRLEKYMDLVFYRVENLNDLRLRLGEWTTAALIKKTARLLETEHQNTCYQINGSTLAVIKKDPLTPSEMEIDRVMEQIKTPVLIGELSVQVYLRSCLTRSKKISKNPQALLDRGLRGLKKASMDNKRRIFFTDEEEYAVQKDMNLIHELGTSFLEGNCYPVYQAIYNEKREVVAFESLTRWTRHDGTGISPDIFIPFLEQSGLMADFFFKMFEKVLDDMKSFPRYFGNNRVFINLSPELINGGFDFDRMTQIIKDRSIETDRLGVEVTESTILKDRQESIHLIEKLRDKGYVIALDDFGTGYSNITQILELPIKKIKFDKSFIQGILREPQKRDLCASLMTHFHKYGYITVAEGVEQEEQWDLLNSLGCREYQGYLLARPVRPE